MKIMPKYDFTGRGKPLSISEAVQQQLSQSSERGQFEDVQYQLNAICEFLGTLVESLHSEDVDTLRKLLPSYTVEAE